MPCRGKSVETEGVRCTFALAGRGVSLRFTQGVALLALGYGGHWAFSPHGICVDLWHLWENIRVPNGHSTFHIPHSTSIIPHPSFHTFKRPLVHEVFAKVGSLLALDALLHLTRFGGVGNHADGVVVAHVFPQPVEQHHHLVFHAEDGAQVHHEPQYPGKEALAAELADLHHGLVAANGRHGAEVVVGEGCELAVGQALVYLLEVLGEVLGLLYGHLRHLRMAVGISSVGGLQALVANGKHAVQARDAVEGVDLKAEATPQVALVDARHGVGPDARHP